MAIFNGVRSTMFSSKLVFSFCLFLQSPKPRGKEHPAAYTHILQKPSPLEIQTINEVL